MIPDQGSWVMLTGLRTLDLHHVAASPFSPQFGLQDLLTSCGIWAGGRNWRSPDEEGPRCGKCEEALAKVEGADATP